MQIFSVLGQKIFIKILLFWAVSGGVSLRFRQLQTYRRNGHARSWAV